MHRGSSVFFFLSFKSCRNHALCISSKTKDKSADIMWAAMRNCSKGFVKCYLSVV